MKEDVIKCMKCNKEFIRIINKVLFCSSECEISYIKKAEKAS